MSVSAGGGRPRVEGVEVAGERIGVRRGVLADVDAARLFCELVPPEAVPAAVGRRLAGFQRGWATVKVDWALDRPVPWQDPEVSAAATVHLAASIDELTMGTAEITAGRIPRQPFVVFGQMTVADPTRSPPGTESAWGYTHLPARPRDPDTGRERPLDRADVDHVVRAVEARVERYAPGFAGTILARHVFAPTDLEAADANLVDGDIGAGTYQLHQQLVFRPWPGWARPETGLPGLYLASASAHPGGGVHGACGANAARAVLMHAQF